MTRKIKPATVPVRTVPLKYFRELQKLRRDQFKPLSRMANKKPKKKKVKKVLGYYRIFCWDGRTMLEFSKYSYEAAIKRFDDWRKKHPRVEICELQKKVPAWRTVKCESTYPSNKEGS